MWGDYMTFLDYLELRRRVESRLSKTNRFFMHLLLFVAITTWLFAIGEGVGRTTTEIRSYYIAPEAGHMMAIWSVLLVLHGLWVYQRSGAAVSARSRAIEAEMRERLQADDTYLSDDPRELFRLHGVLQNDVRQRSSNLALYLAFAIINMMIWLPWAASAASSGFAWQVVPLLTLSSLPVLAINHVRRARHETWLQSQISGFEPVKRKRRTMKTEASEKHLADDGELIDFESMTERKRQQSQG